jgi:nitrogenase molybdenum-cofactor synthesis protein NifE
MRKMGKVTTRRVSNRPNPVPLRVAVPLTVPALPSCPLPMRRTWCTARSRAAGNSWGGRGSLSSAPLLYKMGFTTDLSENDIIFGGEKKLYKAIQDVKERYSPAAVFVYSTCVTALIGDDLDAVCKAAAEKFAIPVIPVHAAGFTGSKNLGNRLAGEALLESVIGTAEPDYTTPYDIN